MSSWAKLQEIFDISKSLITIYSNKSLLLGLNADFKDKQHAFITLKFIPMKKLLLILFISISIISCKTTMNISNTYIYCETKSGCITGIKTIERKQVKVLGIQVKNQSTIKVNIDSLPKKQKIKILQIKYN